MRLKNALFTFLLFCPLLNFAQTLTDPGATNPIAKPSRRLMFPVQQIFAAYPSAGFNNSANVPNTLTFNVLQANASLSAFATTATTNFSSQHNSVAVAGRFTDPSLDQVAYAWFPANGESSAGLQLQLMSGAYPPGSPSQLTSVLSTGANFPGCGGPQAYGEGLALAAGDLDNNVDINGNYHDELVMACSIPGTTNYALTVLDYSAWVGDTTGQYGPGNPLQNLYLPLQTVSTETEAGSLFTQNPSADYMTVALAIGDFDGGGQNEVALVYGTGDSFVVSVYRYANDQQGHTSLTQVSTGTLAPLPSYNSNGGRIYQAPQISVAAGNFNGVGQADQLAVVRVQVSHAPEIATNLEFDPRLSIVQFDSNLNASLAGTEMTYPGPVADSNSPTYYGKAQVASGMFLYSPTPNVSDPDQSTIYNYNRRELAVVTNGEDGIKVYPLSVYKGDITDLLGSNNYRIFSSLGKRSSYSLAAGNFLPPQSGSTQDPVWTLAVSSWSGDGNDTTYSVGIMTFDQNSPCNGLCLSGTPATWPVRTKNGIVPATLPLTAYDYAGNSLYLGTPVHIQTTGLTTTSFILQEPPKHLYYDQTTGDVVNVSRYDTFNSQLVDSSQETYQISKTDSFNWGLGASVGVTASGTVFAGEDDGLFALEAKDTLSLSTQISYDHSSNSSTINSSYATDNFSYECQTNHDDCVTGYSQDFDIWRYRAFGPSVQLNGTPANAFIDFVIPGSKSSFNLGGMDVPGYEPIQENGNVLSYPQVSTANDFHPSDLASFAVGCTSLTSTTCKVLDEAVAPPSEYAFSGTSGYFQLMFSSDISSGTSITKGNNLTESADVKNTATYKATVAGAAGAEGSFSIDLGQSSKFSWTNATTATTTSTAVTQLTGNIAAGSAIDAYYFYPELYFTNDGTMKLAYAANVQSTTLTNTIWYGLYGGKPDAALNLPNKFSPIISGLTVTWGLNPDPLAAMQMRGFFLYSSTKNPNTGTYDLFEGTPSAGDKLRMEARVYNYSLPNPTGPSTTTIPKLTVYFELAGLDAATNLEYSFTSCPASAGSLPLKNGRCLISQTTLDDLAPLQNKLVSANWDTTPWGPTGGDTQVEYHLYVSLDPENKIDETYDCNDLTCVTTPAENNQGWSLVAVTAPPAGSSGAMVAKSQAISDNTGRHLSIVPQSLGSLDALGMHFGNASAEVGHPLKLRFAALSDKVSKNISTVWIYDGNPKLPRNLVAIKRIATGSLNGNYVWFNWTPTKLGQHTLYAKVIQDRDDPSPGGNIAQLNLNVLP